MFSASKVSKQSFGQIFSQLHAFAETEVQKAEVLSKVQPKGLDSAGQRLEGKEIVLKSNFAAAKEEKAVDQTFKPGRIGRSIFYERSQDEGKQKAKQRLARLISHEL